MNTDETDFHGFFSELIRGNPSDPCSSVSHFFIHTFSKSNPLNFSPSTFSASHPSHFSSTLAYTARKSTVCTRSPSPSFSRLGYVPASPPLTFAPHKNRHDAAPWSVPWLAFSSTRRPNSENVSTSTRSAALCFSRSF